MLDKLDFLRRRLSLVSVFAMIYGSEGFKVPIFSGSTTSVVPVFRESRRRPDAFRIYAHSRDPSQRFADRRRRHMSRRVPHGHRCEND